MLDEPETVTLTRDVVAILIPAGTKVELPEGASAVITQALGGSFTVQVQGHLFRINGPDADALGKQVIVGPDVADDASDDELEKAVWAQLRTCYDPESRSTSSSWAWSTKAGSSLPRPAMRRARAAP